MKKTFAISDLHGEYDFFQKIKDFLDTQGTDVTCYVLGDCVDRGLNGFKILKEVIADERFILLKGNHEDLFADSVRSGYLTSLHSCNGGFPTMVQWKKDGEEKKWVGILQDLPYQVTYYNNILDKKVILTHSGFTPWKPNVKEDDYIWNRDHFDDEWIDGYEDIILVHGHTPVPLMPELSVNIYNEHGRKMEDGACFYAKDKHGLAHKINIDCGCFFTNHCTILDLDTFEQHIFYGEESEYPLVD